MSAPTTSVNLELNQIEAGEFVVGSSLVGGSDVIGDGLSDLASYVTRVSIRRGRWGQLFDDFEAASISVVLNNESRLFDPVYASGAYFGELLPGRDVEVASAGVTIATGFVQDWDLDYDVSGRSVAIVKGTDALGRFAALEFDQWTNASNPAPAKLSAVCNRSEVQWPSLLRDFIGAKYDAGAVEGFPVSLAQDTVSWGSNCLNYLQQIARSDWLSWLFVAADGSLTSRPVVQFATLNNDWSPGSSVATFGTGGIPFQAIMAQYGSETLYSEVSIDVEGATAQTASVADVAAWQATYGPSRRLSLPQLLLGDIVFPPSIGGLVDQEAMMLEMAEDLLAFYDTPTYRITEFSVELAGLSGSDQLTVLGIDIAQPITVTFTPNGVGSAITQTLAVQGVAHEITPESHVVTFSVIDYGA